MRLEEGAHPVDCPRLELWRLLPGIDGYLGIRRQRCDIDGCLIWVRRDVVRQDQHRRLVGTHEIARDAVHEVGPHAVKVVQVLLYRFHRHLGPSGAELFGPDILPGIVHEVRVLWPVSNRLAKHAGDEALWGTLHELERKWAADAAAHEEELADAEVVHEPQLVIGERAPRVINRDRTGGFAAASVAMVHGDAPEVVF